jgi:DNA-binding NarL/FixJ family response regulator
MCIKIEDTNLEEVNQIINSLSSKDQKIIALIAEGLSNKDIADNLQLSDATIRNYITNILGQLGMKNRTQIAIVFERIKKSI